MKTIDYFIYSESEKTFKCKSCAKKYSQKTSKTILKRHYNNQHLIPSNQQKLTGFFKTNVKDVKTFRERLIEFFVNGNHPFSIVEETGFENLIKSLSNTIVIPKRKAIQRDVIIKLNFWNSLKTLNQILESQLMCGHQ